MFNSVSLHWLVHCNYDRIGQDRPTDTSFYSSGLQKFCSCRLRLLLLLPSHLQPDGDPGGVQLELLPGGGGLLHLPHHDLSVQHLRGREIEVPVCLRK